MATGDKIYLADKSTLDAVLNRVNNIGYSNKLDIGTGPISLPYPFVNGSAVVLNSEIHILGSTSYPRDHYKFNGTKWVHVSTLPYNFYQGSAVVLNNEIHILGGAGGLTSHYKYDGSSWNSVSTLPIDFQYSPAVVYNNEIHILGGTSTSATNHYKYDGSSWISVSIAPGDMYNGSAIVKDNKIYAVSSNLIYSWDGSVWTEGTLSKIFSRANMVVYQDEIHLIGGSSSDTQNTHYKLVDSSWVLMTTLPFVYDGGITVVYNGELHILGCSSNPLNHRRLNHSLEWEVVSNIKETRYYLLEGTKVYCNNSKTIISTGATRTSYGYLIDTTGVVTISYTDEDSRCFYIV